MTDKPALQCYEVARSVTAVSVVNARRGRQGNANIRCVQNLSSAPRRYSINSVKAYTDIYTWYTRDTEMHHLLLLLLLCCCCVGVYSYLGWYQ